MTEYWSVAGKDVCSTHKTLGAARKAAQGCEDYSGVKHKILKVTHIKGK